MDKTLCTDRYRKVVALARQSAGNFGQKAVGTEHLLLGLLREGFGIGGYVLKSCGLTVDTLKSAMNRNAVDGSNDPVPSLPFSFNACAATEASAKEAEALGHKFIGTEHLLLGLVKSPNTATAILSKFGIDEKRIRDEVLSVLGGEPNKNNYVDFEQIREKCVAIAQILEKYASQSPENADEIAKLFKV